MSSKKVVLIGKYRNTDITGFLQKLANYLIGLSHDVYVEQETKEILGNGYKLADPDDSYDLAIVVGGDGSMMSAARTWGMKGIPLVGVNYGRVGFLTDIDKDSVFENLPEILNGNYKIEERNVFDVTVSNGKEVVANEIAINDVVLGRGVSGKLVEFSVFMDEEFVYSQYADGVVVATPTGSTAYALAAGGSIIHPVSSVLTIVPICPQNLSNRPLVVGVDSKIRVFFSGKEKLYWAIDGVEPPYIDVGNYCEIKKSDKKIKLIHPLNYSYFNGLRKKLGWSN